MPEPENPRDGWCTPEWLADALGWFHLDPCSNLRSHIRAQVKVMLPGDGLAGRPGEYLLQDWTDTFCALDEDRVFINPPFSRGQKLAWVLHWRESNFTFLLPWDPSTESHAALMEFTNLVWFPHERLEFDAPPGITATKQRFPHALFFAREPPDEVGRALAGLGQFFRPASGVLR